MTDFTKFFLWMGKHFLTFVTFAFWDKNLEFLWSLERKYPNLLLILLLLLLSPPYSWCTLWHINTIPFGYTMHLLQFSKTKLQSWKPYYFNIAWNARCWELRLIYWVPNNWLPPLILLDTLTINTQGGLTFVI